MSAQPDKETQMAQGGSGKWTAQDVPDQQGRTVVITGANSGIGLEAGRVLATRGATVVLAGRDPGRTAAAADKVRDAAAGARVETAELDLASLESIRAGAADISARFPRLDLLINNAGVMFTPYGLTKDGFEMQLGTNHLGHFALTGLLLPTLLDVPGSRVVTVSSNGHRAGRMHFGDLMFSRHYRKYAAYGQSKLANLMFTYELQRRLSAAGAPTIATAAHPGTARTDLTRHMSPLSNAAMSSRYRALNSWWVQDSAMGALPTLRAATDPAVTGGAYFGPNGPLQLTGNPVLVRSSARSNNAEAQRRLWAESEKLTQVSYPV
jgi:NAD(P)-dependent dehydrogenase (short-subunit alcohol dehydrogenase family)